MAVYLWFGIVVVVFVCLLLFFLVFVVNGFSITEMSTEAVHIYNTLMHTFFPHSVSIRAAQLRQIMQLMEPGDIIGNRGRCGPFGRCFNAGKYSHSSFVVDKETVVDALPRGVAKRDVLDLLKNDPACILLRPKYENDEQRQHTIEWINNKIGSRFYVGEKHGFYCHRLVAKALVENGVVSVTQFPCDRRIRNDDLIPLCTTLYEVDNE